MIAVLAIDATWSDDASTASLFRGDEPVEFLTETPQLHPLRVVSTGRPLPLLAIRHYAEVAARTDLMLKQYEDGSWWATSPALPGAFGEGASVEEATNELAEVAYEWALLKITDNDRDFAVLPRAYDLNQI